MKTVSADSIPPAVKPRVASIELFRMIAMVAVIALHCEPFEFASPPHLKHTIGVLIDLSCRFAVPFFFMVSGYFFAEKIGAGKPVMATFWRSACRLLSLYAVWCLLYLLVPFKYISDWPTQSWLALTLRHFNHLPEYGLNLPFRGTQETLWFLPSLVMGLGIVAVSVANRWQKYLPYAAIALYLIGLIWGSYSFLWTGSDRVDFAFSTRNGPFFSTLCVTVGWFISTQRTRGRWIVGARSAGFIAIAGLLLQVLESKSITDIASVSFRGFDYLIGTIVFGAGMLLLALANPAWGDGWPILRWSRYTLGVFLIHYIFIDAIKPLDRQYNNAIWEIGVPVVVYLVSLAVVALLARWTVLRRFLS